jgi:uncharacterized protein YabN with tetrapyrrole methylase and pyrophosphatase domain
VGFDWLDLDGPLAKVSEEVEELRSELARVGAPAPETEPDAAVAAEIGDLLFTIVNLARRVNVDPELALRQTSSRFVGRVEEAQRLAAEQGDDWRALDVEAQDRYYELAKERVE